MRNRALLVAALICTAAHAQNWALLNPAYRYNYSNDGTDTISNQIRVMDVDTLGVDSFRYELNGVVHPVGPLVPSQANCWSENGFLLNAPQFLASRVEQYGDTWLLIGTDTTCILNSTTTGQPWTGPGGGTGTVQVTTVTDVFGEPDSVKWITHSNGTALALSKAHGVWWHSRLGQQQHLVGIQGSINAGMRFPTVLDFFDYQPGDILEYRGNGWSTDGSCQYSWYYTNRYEIVQRTDLSSSTEYLIQKAANYHHSGTVLWGTFSCGYYASITNQLVTLSVEHDQWTPANFLGNRLLNYLWPGAYTTPVVDVDNGEFGLWEEGIRWRARKNSGGQYVIDSDPLASSWGIAPTIYPCVEDSLGVNGFTNQTIRFAEGVGRTRVEGYYFESNVSDSLWAHRIDGVQVGTFTPIEIILEQQEVDRPSAQLSPNPASNYLQLTGSPVGGLAEVIDLNGRLVASRTIASANERIDVQQLQPGAYLLALDGFTPQRFMIVR